MINLVFLAHMAFWVSLAVAVNRVLPKAPIPYFCGANDEHEPNGGAVMFMLILMFFALIGAVIIGGMSATMAYLVARDGWHYHSSPDTLFALGFLGNLAQLVGAGCAVFILVRCWPFAVTVGTAILYIGGHYNF